VKDNGGEQSVMMNVTRKTPARIPAWLESQYCASVAAALLARNEYFELLEDAMVPSKRIVNALTRWKQCADQAHVLGGLVGTG